MPAQCKDLPEDVLQKITRRNNDETPGTVRELYEDLNHTVDFGNARFDGLCLEDIYTGSNTDRHVCGVCRLVHRAGEFTEQELEKDPRKRVCKDSQRLLDLTPGISFTYQQLLHSRNVLLSLKSPYDEDFTFRLVEDKSGQWMIIMDWTFGMQYSPPAAWDGELRHLRENFPVCACPHMRSSEPQLLQAIISYWEDDHANPAIVECYTCDTKVELTIPTRPVDNGDNWAAAPWVSFHAERRLGKLGESAVDPRWKAQSLPQI